MHCWLSGWSDHKPITYRFSLQAFINTAREIYKKIQDGVFDVSNEVCLILGCVIGIWFIR